MKVLTPTTKEQLIHYLVQNISLGTYDKKFLTNVYENNKPLTTNQNELLDKIVLRYSRQFAKKKLIATDLINLPWTRPLIISSSEFTDANIYTVDDKIYIRTPYKKDYILKLKEFKYPIIWDRDKRVWHTDYCAETLKFIIHHTENNFNVINYSKDIKETIDSLCEFEKYKYWDPTLVYMNDSYYLMAVNEYLYNSVKELLNDINPYSLTKLVRHGITIDDSVINNTKYDIDIIKFSIETQPTLEVNDHTKLITYLKHIKCDLILLHNNTYTSRFVTTELIESFNSNNIKVIRLDRYKTLEKEFGIDKFKCTVFLTNHMKTTNITHMFTDKLLHLVNSEAPEKVKEMYEIM